MDTRVYQRVLFYNHSVIRTFFKCFVWSLLSFRLSYFAIFFLFESFHKRLQSILKIERIYWIAEWIEMIRPKLNFSFNSVGVFILNNSVDLVASLDEVAVFIYFIFQSSGYPRYLLSSPFFAWFARISLLKILSFLIFFKQIILA